MRQLGEAMGLQVQSKVLKDALDLPDGARF